MRPFTVFFFRLDDTNTVADGRSMSFGVRKKG